MKARFRLMKIGQLADGTRLWFAKGMAKHQPATLITTNKRRRTCIFHFGHDFNIKVKRFDTFADRLVWVRVTK